MRYITARYRRLRLISVAMIACASASASASAIGPAAAAQAASAEVTTSEVTFVGSGNEVLHGTVLAPTSATPASLRPAIVMLEGAGNRSREYLLPEAEAYARHGVITLIYDKRTTGYSLLHRDYSVLADDALAGLRLLRARSDVDPNRLGLWALSEGAFVAPIAANRSKDVKFLITVGAVGTTPAQQTAWAYGQYLQHAGVSGSLQRTMQTTAVRATISAHLFPEATFDPARVWEQVRQPVLAQWGELDRDSVPGQSSKIIQGALDRGGNTRHTIRFVSATNHNLHVTANGGFDRLPQLPANYGDYEADWISDPAQATPNVGVNPEPESAAPAIAPAWYDNRWLQLGTILTLIAAFAGYPITAAISRIRRKHSRGHLPRSASWLVVMGLTTTVGTLIYLVFLLATAGKITGPVVLGCAAPWLALQLLAVSTIVATATVMLSWQRRSLELRTTDRIRLALLCAGGVLFLPWAAYWGLLIP
jgi:hypothetical protein